MNTQQLVITLINDKDKDHLQERRLVFGLKDLLYGKAKMLEHLTQFKYLGVLIYCHTSKTATG